VTSREGIRAAIRAAIPDIRDCYDAWLQARPELGGRLAVRFTIESAGGEATGQDDGTDVPARVTNVRIVSSELDHGLLEGCVLNVTAGLRFRPPRGGKITVTYPFRFAPKE